MILGILLGIDDGAMKQALLTAHREFALDA